MAYLGRYGHQRANDVLSMTITDMRKLVRAVGELIEEENEANRRAETDG